MPMPIYMAGRSKQNTVRTIGAFGTPPTSATTFNFDHPSGSRVLLFAHSASAGGGSGEIGWNVLSSPAVLIGRARHHANYYDDYQCASVEAYLVPNTTSVTVTSWGQATYRGRHDFTRVYEIENCACRKLLYANAISTGSTINATTSDIASIILYCASSGASGYASTNPDYATTFEVYSVGGAGFTAVDLNPSTGTQSYYVGTGGVQAVISLGV